MNKKEIQDALEEIALLLELKGENPFKVRAHQNAARALETTAEDIAALIDTGTLRKIKGIGEGLAKKIEEMSATGRSTLLDKLRAEFPDTIFELFRVPGLGPKKIRALHDQLGVSSLGELEYACRENRLLELSGFGAATQEKVLQGIDFVRRQAGRHLQHRALMVAEELLAFLQNHPAIQRASIAGSLRRRMETVKDIDLIAACAKKDRKRVAEEFCALPMVDVITGSGDTKTSVRLSSGPAVDLRLVTDKEYPYALLHFTGSKEHNIAMRQRAISRGLKLSEYGLFDGEALLAARDETAIFDHLGLPHIPPELREDRGEIAAAEAGKLPVLIEQTDIRGILHVHSNYSDGSHSIRELAEWCRDHGFGYLGLCDHSISAAYAGGLKPEDINRQHEEIDRLNEEFDDFRIFKGIESDITADGSLDYPEKILAKFDFVIASIHSKLTMTEQEATRRLVRAIKNPYTTIVGHLTGRLLTAREGYPLEMNAVLEAAAEAGTTIELNASPHRLDIDWRQIKAARDRGIKIAINPDAHAPAGIDDLRYGLGIARKGWLRAEDVINTLSATAFADFLKKAKSR
jgi:DNA polymerase (family 10)